MIAVSTLVFASTALAEPAPPGLHTLRQPDGTPIRARYIGDEHNLRLEEAQGFTIVGLSVPGGTEWQYADLVE